MAGEKKLLSIDDLDENGNPKTAKSVTADKTTDDRGTLRRLSDAIDRVFMPIADKVDAFSSGAQYGVLGEAQPYVAALAQGRTPSQVQTNQDRYRKDSPGFFATGESTGTLGRDVGVMAATGGASAPLTWANTIGRGLYGGSIIGLLNEGTKYIPQQIRKDLPADPGGSVARAAADTGLGGASNVIARGLSSLFTGRGKIAGSGPALTDAELAAAERQLRTSQDPRYGLQGPGALSATEAARAGASEAPGLSGAAANLETMVRRAGSQASDKLSKPDRVAATARAEPGGFTDQAARAAAQHQVAEGITDTTMGVTPVPGARGGANFTPERQMFAQDARLQEPSMPAQAYPIIKETIRASLHPEEARRAAEATARASAEAARQLELQRLVRNFQVFGGAMKGPVSNEAVAAGAPILSDISRNTSSVGATLAGVSRLASKATDPSYSTIAGLNRSDPMGTLRQIGRVSPGQSTAAGVLMGILDAVGQRSKLRPPDLP